METKPSKGTAYGREMVVRDALSVGRRAGVQQNLPERVPRVVGIGSAIAENEQARRPRRRVGDATTMRFVPVKAISLVTERTALFNNLRTVLLSLRALGLGWEPTNMDAATQRRSLAESSLRVAGVRLTALSQLAYELTRTLSLSSASNFSSATNGMHSQLRPRGCSSR